MEERQRPGLQTIDLSAERRLRQEPIIIQPDHAGRPPNRRVTGVGHAPSRVRRVIILAGITGMGAGAVAFVNYILPPLP